jgi:hypothetical protein
VPNLCVYGSFLFGLIVLMALRPISSLCSVEGARLFPVVIPVLAERVADVPGVTVWLCCC